MKSTWLNFSLVLVLVFPVNLYCQTGVNISKPRLVISNEYLVIEYDILNSYSADLFNVWIEVTNASGFVINARALYGDVGKDITGGLNKRILWNLVQDNILIDEEIFVEVRTELQKPPEVIPKTAPPKEVTREIVDEAVPEEKATKIVDYTNSGKKAITKTNVVISSLFLPGLGQSKIHNGQPYWLLGVAGYGCITGSVILNRKASSTYEDYKQATDINESNLLYDKAVSQDKISKTLAYTAVGIWVADFIWSLATPNSSLESYNLRDGGTIRITPYFDPQWKSTMLTFSFSF